MPSKEQDVHLLWTFSSPDSNAKTVEDLDGVGHYSSTSEDSDEAVSDTESDADDKDDLGDHTSTSVDTSDSDSSSASVKDPGPKRLRRYNDGIQRRRPYSCHILDVAVCRRAALYLMQVGDGRLDRVLDGRDDGRTLRVQEPGRLTKSVWTFLWTLYHNVAEGLPDKFSFATGDIRSGPLKVKGVK